MPTSDADEAACVSGELALLNHMVRANRELAVDLLHPDYSEFGQSGRRYDLDFVLEFLPIDATDIDALDLEVSRLAPDVMLLTYVSERRRPDGELNRANRASVWVRCADGRWRMRHHQGTTVPEELPARWWERR